MANVSSSPVESFLAWLSVRCGDRMGKTVRAIRESLDRWPDWAVWLLESIGVAAVLWVVLAHWRLLLCGAVGALIYHYLRRR